MSGPYRESACAAQRLGLYIGDTLLGEIRPQANADEAGWLVGVFVPTDAFVPLEPLFEASTVDQPVADQIAALGFEIMSAAARRRIVNVHIHGDTIRWKWAT